MRHAEHPCAHASTRHDEQRIIALVQATPKPVPEVEGLRWDDVRLFLALHREGALAPAAARVGIDASTASRKLAALETQLGTRLFDRSREGLRPTAAAELLVPAAERMEAGALAFTRDASGFERAVEGRVRVSAPPGLADVFLAAAAAPLAERHPALTLEIDARSAVVDLSRREADLALRTVRPRGADLVQKRLSTSRVVPLASRSYAHALGTLERFRDARYVTFGELLQALPHAAWMKRHVEGARVVLATDSYTCQLRAAEAGAGIVFAAPTFGSMFDLVPVTLAPSLRRALDELPEDDLWLVGHAATRDVPRIAAVWTFLDELFSGAVTADDARARLAAHRRATSQRTAAEPTAPRRSAARSAR